MKKLLLLIMMMSIVCGHVFAKAQPALESFAQLPDVSYVVLSPDGRKVASMVRVNLPDQKGTSVQVTDVASGEAKIVLFTDNSSYVMSRLQWKDNKSLLAYGFAAEELEFRGISNMHTYKTRVYRLLFVDTETGEVTKPFTKMFLTKFRSPPSDLSHVVSLLRDDPKHVLMNVMGTVYKVNIHKGNASIYGKQPNNFSAGMADRQNRLRVGYHLDGKTFTIKFYDLKKKKWSNLVSYEGAFSEDDVDPLGFGADPNVLYISAYHENRKAVFSVDLKDPEFKRELVFSHPKYDVGGSLIYSRKDKTILGVTGGPEMGSLFMDEEFAEIQEKINKAIPNASNRMYSYSDDFSRFLVYSTGPKESGTYYLVEREPLKVTALAYRYNNLTPDVLNPVERISYKARDELEIEAFLTLPASREHKNLPTLMFPHGGPIARDSNAFDYWAQYFASKGYAILQMNFRGSAGYGFSHQQAGLAKWGEEMQDDVEDGARYLIDQGISDPNKISIMGASYGGYAALMGAVKTPDFYKCSISVNGVSDVRDLVLKNRAFWRTYNVVDEQIGTGASHLKNISPINHAEKIKAPVLLIHGELDRQVEPSHSERMAAELEKKGKRVEYVSLPNEDHYLSYEDNRILSFKTMDRFLDDCMPAN